MESLTFKQDPDGIFHIDTLAKDIQEGGDGTSEGPAAGKLWEVACGEAERAGGQEVRLCGHALAGSSLPACNSISCARRLAEHLASTAPLSGPSRANRCVTCDTEATFLCLHPGTPRLHGQWG